MLVLNSLSTRVNILKFKREILKFLRNVNFHTIVHPKTGKRCIGIGHKIKKVRSPVT